MRLANVGGRAAVLTAAGAVDVERASQGWFGPDPQDLYPRWRELSAWASGPGFDAAAGCAMSWSAEELGPPSPTPRQVFAVGLNYVAHAAEGGFDVPSVPSIFTKYVSCLTGPRGEIGLPPGQVDWEVELVVVLGRQVRDIAPTDVWSVVAGLTVGQDISERVTQHRPPAPQFSLGKSFAGFGPIGPVLVTPDEFADPDDIELRAVLNGEVVQHARTSDMVFDVPTIVSYLSGIVTLFPGDVIFTGTPPGVGKGRTPQRFLTAGDVLESSGEGIGRMRHTFGRQTAAWAGVPAR